MTIAPAELSPEAAQRWAQRAETLAQWLLAMWRRELAEGSGMVDPLTGSPSPQNRT